MGQRPKKIRCRQCGKFFDANRYGKMSEFCPDCRRLRNLENCKMRKRELRAKEKQPEERKTENPDGGSSALRKQVSELCEINARREAEGKPPLTYGKWKLQEWKRLHGVK